MPTQLASYGWFRLALETPDEDSLGGFDLEVGTLDGRLTNRISTRYGPLAPSASFRGALPVAAGPFGDTVAYAFWNGSESEIRAVSVTTGEDRLLAKRDAIVHALTVSAADRVVYFIELDPETRRDLGMSRISMDQPDHVDLFRPNDVAKAPGAIEQIWKRLWLTPNGSLLVVIDCPRACRAEIIDPDQGVFTGSFELGEGDVVGVTDDAIVTVLGCAPPCPATQYPLSGEQPRPFGVACAAGVLATVGARPALISDWPIQTRCDGDRFIVGRTTLADDVRDSVLIAETHERSIVAHSDRQGVATPDAWFLLGPGGGLVTSRDGPLVAPVLVHAADGTVVELPPLGPPRSLD